MTQKTLSVKLELLTADFTKNLEKSVKGVLDSTKKMTKSIQSLGAKMSVAIALPATLIGKSLLKMAGDAEDANDKFTAIFGESAPKVEKSIQNLSKVFTRNATDLKNYASEFGSMLTSMDLTEEEAGSLSRSMVQLGLDVASLRGISDAKVMDAFTASLTGNVRGLKQLGIAISDADMENEGLLLGIARSAKEFTERDKALIMASLLQKNFTKDVGDASKSQNDWGEVMNQFNGKVKTLGENLGKELIPMVSSLVDKIEPLIEYFMSLDDSVKRGAMSVLVFAVLLPPLITVMGTLGNAFITLISSLWSFIRVTAIAIASVLTFIGSIISTAWAWFVAQVGGMASMMTFFGTTILPIIVIIGGLVQSVRMFLRFFGLMAEIIGENADAITKLFIPASLALISSLKGVVYAYTYAKNALEGHQEASNQARIATESFTEAEEKLKKAWTGEGTTVFADKIREKMLKLETTMKDSAVGFDEMLVSMKNATKDFFVGTFESISGGAKDLGNTIATKAGEGFKTGFEYMKDLMIGSLALLGDADPFKNLKKPKGAKGSLETQGAIPEAKPNELPSFMGVGGSSMGEKQEGERTDNGAKPSQITLDLWDQFADHIKETMITTADVVKGVWDNVFNGFASGISGMILEGNSFAETFRNMFKSLADFVIQSIIKMGLQWLVTEMMKRTVSATTSKLVQSDAITTAVVATTASVASSQTMIANNAIVAGSGAASSQSSIPIIGPILAVAAMGAMIATVMALQGKLKLASGGVTQGPTNALIGEKGKEAVIPLDRLDSMMGNREQTILINLDGRQISRSVIKHSPREIRLNTGVIM